MTEPKRGHTFSRYDRILFVLFLATLPLVNPWVRGDGVGYYAYAQSLLIHRSLNFEDSWRAANPTFRMGRVDGATGKILADQYTRTGHLNNHFTVGPAMLWLPFLGVTHVLIVFLNHLGADFQSDGFSRPYLLTMALGTATYGFLGVWLGFRIARNFVEERWAFLAALGIWFASPLPVYMYFNPSWSHAHSAFAVALFLWYCHRTSAGRTLVQWCVLGGLAGLMMDVYYPNAVVLLVPALEMFWKGLQGWRSGEPGGRMLGRAAAGGLIFAVVTLVAFLPTLVSRQVIFGNPLDLGYVRLSDWNWTSPVLARVLLSSEHGLLSWNPILGPAILGLFWFRRRAPAFGLLLSVSLLCFYYLIASYPDWAGIASFGNRFFLSFITVFVIGLAALLDSLARAWQQRPVAWRVCASAVGLLILWNAGFIFQWGMHLVPARGSISWKQMARNQVLVVPAESFRTMERYLFARQGLMGNIEQEDLEHLKKKDAPRNE